MNIFMYRERERAYCWMGGARCFIPISPKDAQKSKKEKTIQLPPTSLKCPTNTLQKKNFPEKERMSQIVFQPSFFRGFDSFVGSNHGIKAPTRIQKKHHPDHPGESMPPLHFSVELLQVSAFFQA